MRPCQIVNPQAQLQAYSAILNIVYFIWNTPFARVAEVHANFPNQTLTEGQQRMFTHVMVGANDLAASKKFYDAVLDAIGLPAGQADPKGRIFYRTKTGVFGITKPIDRQLATHVMAVPSASRAPARAGEGFP